MTSSPSTLGYGHEDEPLAHYAALVTVFAGAMAFAGWTLRRRLPKSIPPTDLALLGLATTRLSRYVTRDMAGRALRAPFTDVAADAKPQEVKEKPRSQRGSMRALGELVTCPRCTGVWAAGALTVAYIAAPKATRFVATAFAAASLSDHLNALYAKTERS